MTPVDPPPGLLDKVAEAIEDGLFRMHGITSSCDHRSEAELVWDAVAEGLGLTEEVHPFPVVGQRPRTAQDSGLVLDDTPVSVIERWTVARRLVSKWEPQP